MRHSNHTNNTPGSSYEENHSINTKKRTLSPNPSRKTRTKTRKPKFLSLQRELITQGNSPDSGEMTHHHHQLNLFPLHPENLFEEKDIHDDNVAYLFNTDGGATLNGLLGSGGGGGVVSSEKNSLSPSLTYAYGGQDSDEGASSLLARAALRHKERDDSEEKWVFYSEVVEEKKEEEVSSCTAAGAVSTTAGDNQLWCKNQSSRVLSLKLDYEEILNAWSDKRPLFIEGECPQTVPDVLDGSATVLGDGGCMGNGMLWTVPDDGSSEIISGDGGSGINGDGGGGGGGGGESWKMAGQREASVLRYKEKRQNRLFAKRIRYEVRKLNAEKRPRMKGRFVKRS